MSELTDDRPHEPILTSQGGFVYNKPWIDYWEARALKAEAAHRALLSGKSAVLPQTKEHAEHLYTVAVACLKTYGVDVEADLRAAASTSTEAAGLDDLARAIAASHGVIFEELEEHGDDGENKTTYRRLAAKRVRALTPPTPKVTT